MADVARQRSGISAEIFKAGSRRQVDTYGASWSPVAAVASALPAIAMPACGGPAPIGNG